MQESHMTPLEQVKQFGGHLEHTVELKLKGQMCQDIHGKASTI